MPFNTGEVVKFSANVFAEWLMDGHQMARPDLAPIAMLVWKLRISQQIICFDYKGLLEVFSTRILLQL